MKPKINIDHICALAHLKLTEEEKSLLAPQIIADADTRDSTLSPQSVPDYPKEMKRDLKSM